MARFDMKAYARLGVEARVAQIRGELTEIYRAFPGLRGAGRPAKADVADAAPVRQRKPMSAAMKRAVSRRMKARWAKWRKEHGKN